MKIYLIYLIKSGLDCFAAMSKAYKIPKAIEYNYSRLNNYFDEESGKYICTARPILGYNRKYEKQILTNCYEYDLNSAEDLRMSMYEASEKYVERV